MHWERHERVDCCSFYISLSKWEWGIFLALRKLIRRCTPWHFGFLLQSRTWLPDSLREDQLIASQETVPWVLRLEETSVSIEHQTMALRTKAGAQELFSSCHTRRPMILVLFWEWWRAVQKGFGGVEVVIAIGTDHLIVELIHIRPLIAEIIGKWQLTFI